jgi:hypothetical protein|nr:MAG TPA: hypothetical protein [Caudoviricetes sp.]
MFLKKDNVIHSVTEETFISALKNEGFEEVDELGNPIEPKEEITKEVEEVSYTL